jgi:hypothetical protein
MNKRDKAEMLICILTAEVNKRAARPAKQVIEELWSEAMLLAERGSQLTWHRFVYDVESGPSSDWWFTRIQNKVLRETGRKP